MMKACAHKKVLFGFLVSVIVGVSACSSPSSGRKPSSVASEIAMTDPSAEARDREALQAEFTKAGKYPAFLKKRLQVAIGWVRKNPVVAFDYFRETSPVLTLESIPLKGEPSPNVATVLVTRYDDVEEIFRQPKIFSIRDYVVKMDESVGPFMLARDGGPLNEVEKPWMRKMLDPKDFPRIRQTVRKLAQDAVAQNSEIGTRPDGTTPYASLEIVNQLGRRVPIELTGAYFGFPGPGIKKMYEWSHATQDDFFHNPGNDKQAHILAVEAGKQMHAYLTKLVAEKRAKIAAGSPDDDILTRMIVDGVKETDIVTDDRIRSNIIGTLVGGVETTQAAVVQSVNQMLKHPEILAGAQAAAASGNDELLGRYVWEALRFDPVNPFVIRYAEQDTKIGGVMIKKGSIVLVATQSAMFDPSHVSNPKKFSVDPAERPNQGPGDVYFHLGAGLHRCLGDYVSEIQVPEIVKALITVPSGQPRPGLRVSSGYAGVIYKTVDDPKFFDHQEDRRAFPERLVVEFDPAGMRPNPGAKVIDPRYAFEEYLQDFDRNDFRLCMSGTGIISNIQRHRKITSDKSLFFCRLKPAFRDCMAAAEKDSKIDFMEDPGAHLGAVDTCRAKAPLTDVEYAFYQDVILGRNLDLSTVPNTQASGKGSFDFERILRYYDRITDRECFMNPKASSSFPKTPDGNKQMIFYARLNLPFRKCMGPPVILNELTHGVLGTTRAAQYEKCRTGSLNTKLGIVEGALTLDERYYYRKMLLADTSSYAEIMKEESAQ
jgi:cytochrome P450